MFSVELTNIFCSLSDLAQLNVVKYRLLENILWQQKQQGHVQENLHHQSNCPCCFCKITHFLDLTVICLEHGIPLPTLSLCTYPCVVKSVYKQEHLKQNVFTYCNSSRPFKYHTQTGHGEYSVKFAFL